MLLGQLYLDLCLVILLIWLDEPVKVTSEKLMIWMVMSDARRIILLTSIKLVDRLGLIIDVRLSLLLGHQITLSGSTNPPRLPTLTSYLLRLIFLRVLNIQG